jgi:hypothetical protein
LNGFNNFVFPLATHPVTEPLDIESIADLGERRFVRCRHRFLFSNQNWPQKGVWEVDDHENWTTVDFPKFYQFLNEGFESRDKSVIPAGKFTAKQVIHKKNADVIERYHDPYSLSISNLGSVISTKDGTHQ